MCHLKIVSNKRSMGAAALNTSNIYRIKFANAPCIPSELKGMAEKGPGQEALFKVFDKKSHDWEKTSAGKMVKRAYRFLHRMFFHAAMPCRLKSTTQHRTKRMGAKIRVEIFSDRQKKNPRINRRRSIRVGRSQDR